MNKKSNLNSTKDELIKNFSKEQLEVYNYYKSKFSYSGTELITVNKEDKEIAFLENSCSVLKTIFKVELVFALIILTFAIIFDIFPETEKTDSNYEQIAIIQTEYIDKN